MERTTSWTINKAQHNRPGEVWSGSDYFYNINNFRGETSPNRDRYPDNDPTSWGTTSTREPEDSSAALPAKDISF